MSWTYRQRTGALLRDGCALAVQGYAGNGIGKNNPDLQEAHNVGPIPQGRWRIVEMIPETASHGPYVLRLLPSPETITYGRSGFLIHGDSSRRPGSASLGCIILPRSARELIWMSGDRALEVESGDEAPPLMACHEPAKGVA